MKILRGLALAALMSAISFAMTAMVGLECGYRWMLRGSELPREEHPKPLTPRVARALWVAEGRTGPIRVRRRYPWNLYGLDYLLKPADRQGPVYAESSLDSSLARMSLTRPERTVRRLFREVAVCTWLGRHYSADELLALYASTVWMGEGREGLEAGAQAFFGKRLEELDTAQLALVVGIPQNPSRYDPITHPDRTLERRNKVLERFRAGGLIDETELTSAKAEPLGIRRSRSES